LFNLISGVYPVDAGVILLEGKPIQDMPPRRRVSAGLARSFQNIRLMPHLSVVENVMLGQHVRVKGTGAALAPLVWRRGNKWRRFAEQSLRDAGIEVDPDADVSTLSYGIRKRIEVVRALMSQPRLLMLDEPAAGLNTRETAELSLFLKSVARDGVTLLVVEHDMSFIHDLCELTVVLNFGRLIYQGPTAGVHDDEEVRAAYLGRRRIHAEGASPAA
jgi:branched-chain amino acid transport system ATP-binding protein